MAQRTGPSVGFIGLGRMGKPMALNLVAAGFQVVVHSRSPDPVAEVTSAGASAAANPGQVASSANIVCTCLPDEMASEAVYLGEDGLLSTAGPLSLLIETSTIGPALAKRIGEAAKAKGAGYLDAPVSGGVVRAVDASLTIMAGGEADDLERAMPVLQAMGAGIHHVGALGQGSAVKLINQLLVAVHTQAACEAMVLGMRAGADPTQLLEVLSSSGGGGGASNMLARTGPMVATAEYGSLAPTRLVSKDIGLVTGMAAELGVPLPLGDRARQAIGEAMEGGLGETDIAALATLLE